MYSPNEKDLLMQMPGFWLFTGLNNEFIKSNHNTVKLLGFKNLDEMIGLTAADTRCKAAEYADVFNEQYNRVMRQQMPLTIIDLHPFYEDNRQVMFLTQKSPIRDATGNTAGVMWQGVEITQQKLFNITMSIINKDKCFYSKKYQNRSYTVVSSFNSGDCLSDRELECLFFLIRGKTASNIAKILSISKRTVEYHIDNIKNKFGCDKKSDLIGNAIDNGFINLIPKSFFQSERNISVEV